MKCALLSTVCLFALVGCTPADRTPEAIKQDTAKVTAEAKQDAKAVVKGVAEGLKTNGVKTNGAVNINTASSDDLQSLPGINAEGAHRIIVKRPYSDIEDLVKRHAVSKAEYDRISGKIATQ